MMPLGFADPPKSRPAKILVVFVVGLAFLSATGRGDDRLRLAGGEPVQWSEPEQLPYPVNVDGGWTDMPAIDPTGDGLWFVYWNGDHQLFPILACDEIGPVGVGSHGDNFDIYFAAWLSGSWQQPIAFEPAPSERFSGSLDLPCLHQSIVCGCNAETPDVFEPDECNDVTLPCSHYQGCRVMGSEAAAVRSFDGESLYFSREELELNRQGLLAPTVKIWVAHLERDGEGQVIGWGDAIRLPGTINARGVRVDTPTISPDNRRLCVSRATNEAFNATPGDGAFELWCARRWKTIDDRAWGRLRRSRLNRKDGLDYQPMFTAQGNLLFTTTRGGGLTVHQARPSLRGFVDIGIFPALTWYDGDHHEGAGSLSADGRTFYFLRSTGPGGGGFCSYELRIFKSQVID
jgi:hypothetical protein